MTLSMAEFETLANNSVTASDAATGVLAGNGGGIQPNVGTSSGLASGLQSGVDDKATVVCPHCSKLYQLVNPQETLVYQCQQCQTQFMIRREGARFSTLKWSEDQILKVLFEIPGQSGPSQISRAWKQVFDQLDDPKAHENFILICRQKNSLGLAREKYRQLALYLNWNHLPQNLREILEPQRIKPSVWSERMPWILLAASAVIMLLGALLPGQRNMVGAGVLVLILDFLIYRKRFQAFF